MCFIIKFRVDLIYKLEIKPKGTMITKVLVISKHCIVLIFRVDSFWFNDPLNPFLKASFRNLPKFRRIQKAAKKGRKGDPDPVPFDLVEVGG